MLELRHDLNFWDGLPLLLEYCTKTLKDKKLPLIMMHIKSETAVYLRYQCKVIGLNRSYAIIGGSGGTRDVPPGPNSFIFMQFLRNEGLA